MTKLQVKEFLNDIEAQLKHGECFHDAESFSDLCITIDLFKSACKDVYEKNQED